MVCGGLQKNSFIDYPGKISCVLFLAGCNFRCPYCHNPELVLESAGHAAAVESRTVFDFLEKHRGFLEGVVVSGGEPTLQSDLEALCERIKSMGYPVKVDTNGSRPRALQRLISRGLVDYIAMDVKTAPENYAPLIQKKATPEAILSSIGLILKSGLPHEFRTTCVKPLTDERNVDRITTLIAGCELYALQRFQSSSVLCPEFFQQTDFTVGENELHRFQSLAEPRVTRCIIR